MGWVIVYHIGIKRLDCGQALVPASDGALSLVLQPFQEFQNGFLVHIRKGHGVDVDFHHLADKCKQQGERLAIRSNGVGTEPSFHGKIPRKIVSQAEGEVLVRTICAI
jgi:hypothetical protein